MRTLLDALVVALETAGRYNSQDEAPPAAILWPDTTRGWAPMVPVLGERIPVLTLGEYRPEARSGPSAWVRCIVDGSLGEEFPRSGLPVVYLPGVSARQIREPHDCPPGLFELQYRGTLWCRRNGDDWTPAGFLADGRDGPGIEVRRDERTAQAMVRALPVVATMPLSLLREDAPWRASDFDRLVEPFDPQQGTGIEDLVRRGEGQSLEFKATAFYDTRTKGANNVAVKQEVVVTVAAFMNSRDGGTLLIGVEDDGSLRGIAEDHRTASANLRNNDGYERRLRDLLFQGGIGRQFAHLVEVTFRAVEQQEVCVVSVSPAPRPVVVKGRGGESFYVRVGNLSQKLDLSSVIHYVQDRWPDQAGRV